MRSSSPAAPDWESPGRPQSQNLTARAGGTLVGGAGLSPAGAHYRPDENKNKGAHAVIAKPPEGASR